MGNIYDQIVDSKPFQWMEIHFPISVVAAAESGQAARGHTGSAVPSEIYKILDMHTCMH